MSGMIKGAGIILGLAALVGTVAAIKAWQRSEPDKRKKALEALKNAVRCNIVDDLKKALKDPMVEPSKYNSAVLDIAAKWDKKDGEIMKLLLEDGRANPTSRTLQKAVDWKNVGAIRQLVRDGRIYQDVVKGNHLLYSVVATFFLEYWWSNNLTGKPSVQELLDLETDPKTKECLDLIQKGIKPPQNSDE